MTAMDDDARKRKDGWEAIKQDRLTREADWVETNRFCGDTSDAADSYSQGLPDTSTGQRNIYTGVGILNSKRLAAMLVTYSINPVRPFLQTNVEAQVDASSGFVTQNRLTTQSKAYLSGLSWYFFEQQMRTKSNFMKSVALAMRDFVNFGPGIRFTKLNALNQARWVHCPSINCWFRLNEDGEYDTMYRRSFYRLSRLVELFPKALENDRLRKQSEGGKCQHQLIEVIHCVQPRPGGKAGQMSNQKPFASQFFLSDYDGLLLKEEGFDTFPYSIAANGATAKNPYGHGIAEAALPDIRALNHYQAGLENNIDLTNEPPMLYMQGLFNKFSFDAGALTGVDPFSMTGYSLSESVMPIKVGGQITPVMGFAQWLEQRIGEFFFADWMKLRESGTMTATEVNDRRDLRLRGVSSLVPDLAEMFSHEADRLLELYVARRLLPPPPVELSSREVVWDYRGPLWDAMKASQSDTDGKIIQLWQGMIAESPEVADIIDIEYVIRNWADALGAEPGSLRTEEAVKVLADKREAAKQQEMQMAQMQATATSARDAAQGVASMANAGNPQAIAAAQDMKAA